ncbi:MAG: hypothetical protein M3308_06810 [Actinomycetota bacterium]|nr:hypothetical protein [Actinomycetota bacterium]
MWGFKTFRSAARFCSAYEEQRPYFRARQRTGERMALAEERRLFQERWAGVLREVRAG